ncbi:MAG: hypothetical protein ACE5HA_06130 [Anaerolineae bacterium]
MRWPRWAPGALAGGVIGGMFHLAWHMRVAVPLLSDLLWEWGGLFVGVARYELIGLHLGVLVVHVAVYAVLGALMAAVVRR